MKFILESDNLEDYLKAIPPVISWDTPMVKAKIAYIQQQANNAEDKARMAFEIARDEINHSFDTKNPIVTIAAEEVMRNKEGICFAKSHLLASLLRGLGIPVGFCYQKVLRKTDDPQSG